MIIVQIPNNFKEERSYIIDVILSEFLGLNYQIEVWDQPDYRLKLERNKSLTIKDAFFSSQNENSGYLLKENIPLDVTFTRNQFVLENELPILYGNDQLRINKDHITCGLDLFASSFYMLTRWEEYVITERDRHNRFSASNSLAFRYAFLNRPIVNEYTEMLWNMLTYLSINQDRKERKFEFITTHDVDHVERWTSVKGIVKDSARELLKNKRMIIPLINLLDFLKVKAGLVKDPYDTFGKLMDLSDEFGIKSHFYFMSGGVTKNDNYYSITGAKARGLIKEIKARDHIIGFHPSYAAYNDLQQWKKEKDLLEQVTGTEIREGRQHYLQFENPTTWQIWQDNEMQIDSTLSYADAAGFRCGTCYEFPVFNIVTREMLALKERPLIAMEVSFSTYRENNSQKMLDEINDLVDKVKKYNGTFVFLWHNSSFAVGVWKNLDYIYEEVLKRAVE